MEWYIQYDINDQVAEGVRILLDFNLDKILLYSSEKGQYHQAMKEGKEGHILRGRVWVGGILLEDAVCGVTFPV